MTASLETSRLLLRPVGVGDVDALHELWTSEGVRRFLWDGEVIPRSRTADVVHRSQELFSREGYGLWVVHDGTETVMAGFAGFWHFRDPPDLELLFGVATPKWGLGYATEAARRIMQFGFGELGWDTILASTDVGNTASARVLDKLGMILTRRAEVNGLDTNFYLARRPADQTRSASRGR